MKICCDDETEKKSNKEHFYTSNILRGMRKSKRNGTSHLLNLFRLLYTRTMRRFPSEQWKYKREVEVSPFFTSKIRSEKFSLLNLYSQRFWEFWWDGTMEARLAWIRRRSKSPVSPSWHTKTMFVVRRWAKRKLLAFPSTFYLLSSFFRS